MEDIILEARIVSLPVSVADASSNLRLVAVVRLFAWQAFARLREGVEQLPQARSSRRAQLQGEKPSRAGPVLLRFQSTFGGRHGSPETLGGSATELSVTGECLRRADDAVQ